MYVTRHFSCHFLSKSNICVLQLFCAHTMPSAGMWLTNRFHVAVSLINRSQLTSKCCSNKKVAHAEIAECVTDQVFIELT